MANIDTDQGFEWVVSETGFEADAEELLQVDEPRPEPVSSRTLWQLPRRRTWLYLILPTLVIVGVVWGGIQWRDWQTRRQIEAAVAALTVQPPLPLNFLRPLDETPVIHTLTVLDGNRIRADLAYAFSAPDGERVTFALPLVFRREGEDWAFEGAFADPTPNQTTIRTGPRVELRYLGSDGEFMLETLGPYLDEMMQAACEAWGCDDHARISLDFTEPEVVRRADNPPIAGLADDSLLLHVLLNSPLPATASEAQVLPPPHVAGYPADAGSLQLYRRTIALQALLRLAQAAPAGSDQLPPISALFDALLVRQVARLGLESPTALSTGRADEPWSLESLGQPVTGIESARGLRRALALFDELLRDQPPEVEAEIFRTARTRSDSFETLLRLVGELGERGMKPETILRRLQSVLNPQDSEPWHPRPTFAPEAMMMCETGLYAYSAGQTQRLLPDMENIGMWLTDWSPDGRWLAAGTFFHGFVLDLETGETQWTPDVAGDAFSVPVGFTASGALAYHKLGLPFDTEFDFSRVEWRLFDPRTDQSARSGARGFWSIGFLPFQAGPSLSPDRKWVVVMEQPGGIAWESSEFSLMPAEGGAADTPRVGFTPAWSADSRLAYFSPHAATDAPLQLVVRDHPAFQETRVVLTFDWQPPSGREAPQVIWSPDSNRLAFVLGTDDKERVALGVVSRRGEGLQLTSVENSEVTDFAFSPEGTVLAVLVLENTQHNLVLYDAATLKPRRTLVGQWRDFAWAPDGRLWLFKDTGVFGLDLADEQQPTRLLDRSCLSILWRP